MAEPAVENNLTVPGSDTVIRTVAMPLAYGDRASFKILIDSQEQDEISSAIADQSYAFPFSFELLLQLAQPGRRVLDLGAHIGTFSLLAAALGYAVIAVEASPRNATMLHASAELNHFDRLQIVPGAVSDRSETLEFVQAGPYGLVATPYQSDPTITVQATSVDALLAELEVEQIDFIKMDVEGSEVKAVAGMAKLLAKPDAPAILYESNGHTLHYFGQTPADLIHALRKFGYQIFRVEQNQLVPLRDGDLQFHCTVDCLATKTPLPALPHWRVTAPLTHEEQVAQILAVAAETHPHLRSYLGRTLAHAPLRLLADARVLWVLGKLTNDADPTVRAGAAWFPATIPLPFAAQFSKIRALQRYLALAVYASKRLR